MDIDTLLLQGRELIDRTSRAHTERWGLGKSQRWALDQSSGRISWSFEDHVASAPAQILGSWNGQAETFAWSWDNDTVVPGMRRTAEVVRAWGTENEVAALTGSPLRINEAQVRDLIALAFRLGGCTGLYHPFDGTLATYITFGPVLLEEAGGRTSTFEVPNP